ncbi:MAG: hypothetical protein IT531_03995 [Burkholderiales bacterium]|nr:hypothetical protein [Burkholderiales bacterium]
MTPTDAELIRRRALVALSSNRVPGYHFPGHFLDLQCTRYDRGGIVLEMDTCAHNSDPGGTANLGAVAFLADMALASSCRVFVDPTRRTATLKLHMDFCGGEARGRIRAQAHSSGFSERTALAQAQCYGEVSALGRPILRMTGTWVSPPSPDGRPLHPLPWEHDANAAAAPLLAPGELDAMERDVLKRVERALRDAKHGEFMQRLWAPVVRHGARGTTGRLPLGLHVGNRVGHVQGGLSLYTALVTALAAVPHHPVLTAVSAWYISPGEGRSLNARTTILQKGRNIAVVRAEVFATGGKRVLEVVSNHAIARR